MKFKRKITSKKIGSLLAAVVVAVVGSYLNQNQRALNQPPSGEIIYTKHAKCRMNCRHIDRQEVISVLNSGSVNTKKSNPSAKPCPVFAREKKTKDGQNVRVVYAKCSDKNKIITVIDLGRKYDCECE